MYAYYFHVVNKETGFSTQVGCAQLSYLFEVGDLVTGNLLWESYEGRLYLHKVRQIEKNFGDRLTIYLVATKKMESPRQKSRLHVIEFHGTENSFVVFRPKESKTSNDWTGRISKHRQGYSLTR